MSAQEIATKRIADIKFVMSMSGTERLHVLAWLAEERPDVFAGMQAHVEERSA